MSEDLISRQAAIDALDCINGVEEVLRSLPSADVDLDKYSEKIWATAYQRGVRHGITTCSVCVHLHDNYCPVLCGRQLDDYYSWAEREGEDET